MSATIDTFTSNWFRVKYPSIIEEYVDRVNDHLECLPSGEALTLHHHKGQIRLTGFDMIDQSLDLISEKT